MRKILLSLLSIAALGFAPAPVYRERPNGPETILRRLQGSWEITRYEYNDVSVHPAWVSGYAVVVRDKMTFFRRMGEGRVLEETTFTLRLDPKADSPEIDFVEREDYVFRGVYELNGGRLKVVFRLNAEGKFGRATNLDKPGRDEWLRHFERKP